jgi:aryl-alcohol dehydrogenase-like predicted oxidoreductase
MVGDGVSAFCDCLRTLSLAFEFVHAHTISSAVFSTGDPMPDVKAQELIKAVYDAGCRHYDTAEAYRTGDKYNEATLGDFFQTVPRDSFSVATKYWPSADQAADYETVKSHLMASLKRLKLDYVDLYYAHRVKDMADGMEFARSAKRLKEEGLIKEIGLSEVSPSWLKKIHTEIVTIDAIQQEWSLLTRNLEKDLVPVCKELGVSIVAYSPLARNMLASKIEVPPNDWRATLPRFAKENLAANQKVSDLVQQIAEKYQCTSAQLSLAWLLHKGSDLGVNVYPIPGSTKMEHALGNLKASQIDIQPADMQELEALADLVAGARATDGYIQMGFESQAEHSQ